MRLVLVSQILKEWTTYGSATLGITLRQKTALSLGNEVDLEDNSTTQRTAVSFVLSTSSSRASSEASSSSEEEHENRSCTPIADTEFTVRIPSLKGGEMTLLELRGACPSWISNRAVPATVSIPGSLAMDAEETPSNQFQEMKISGTESMLPHSWGGVKTQTRILG